MPKHNRKLFNLVLIAFCWTLTQCITATPETPTIVAVVATTAVPATATLEPTATATTTHTAEPTSTPTATATATETLTPSPTATNTSTPRPTAIPATATFTVTPPPPLELTEFETALRGTNQYTVLYSGDNCFGSYSTSGTIEFSNSNVMTLISPDRIAGAGRTYSRTGPNQWIAVIVNDIYKTEITLGIGQNAFTVNSTYFKEGNVFLPSCRADWVKQ